MAFGVVYRGDLWSKLEKETLELEETGEEANAFDEAIRQEIAWKVHSTLPEDGRNTPRQSAGSPLSAHAESVGVHTQGEETNGWGREPPLAHDQSGPANATQMSAAAPSSRFRSLAVDSTIVHASNNTTLPYVATPKAPLNPLLPGPSKRSLQRASAHTSPVPHPTPEHVESPIDTPRAIRASGSSNSLKEVIGHGRGKRTDPATPVPLGSADFSSLRGKKDYQSITKHFDLFNKDLAKEIKAAEASGKGKGSKGKKVKNDGAAPAMGAKVFEGLRFCIPPELGQVARHKVWWGIISQMGGQVTLQPDTAITHVICDRNSASILARELGLQTLSELPLGTVCVKWQWVVDCKMSSKVLNPTPFLSFPTTTLTRQMTSTTSSTTIPYRASSRLIDITEQLKGKSISISRRREHTASDSETDSPKRSKRTLPVHMSNAALQNRQSRSAVKVPLTGANANAGPSRLNTGPNATKHDLTKGPRWEVAPEGDKDGLDDMISGVMHGTIEDDHPDSADEQETELPEIDADEPANGTAYKFKCAEANDGSEHSGPNEWLAKKLEELHDMYQGDPGKNPFSIRQYQTAASIMRRTTYAITSREQAIVIKGIGEGMADRIQEFISGNPGRQFYENNEERQTLTMLRKVHGVGPRYANEFYRRGVRSIDDLRTKDYGLNTNQLIGVELYDDIISGIPRAECKEISEQIRAQAVAIDPKIWIEIMGSYRRGQETCGDIDILITRDTADGLNHSGMISKLVEALKRKGIITHELSMPQDWKALETKWTGVCRVRPGEKYRRLDILCIPFEQWGAALLYFTGNEIFNRSMRLYARKKGYSLNQRGLSIGVIRGKDGLKLTEGEIIASRTEQEIFDVLGLRWRHPHHRRP